MPEVRRFRSCTELHAFMAGRLGEFSARMRALSGEGWAIDGRYMRSECFEVEQARRSTYKDWSPRRRVPRPPPAILFEIHLEVVPKWMVDRQWQDMATAQLEDAARSAFAEIYNIGPSFLEGFYWPQQETISYPVKLVFHFSSEDL